MIQRFYVNVTETNNMDWYPTLHLGKNGESEVLEIHYEQVNNKNDGQMKNQKNCVHWYIIM